MSSRNLFSRYLRHCVNKTNLKHANLFLYIWIQIDLPLVIVEGIFVNKMKETPVSNVEKSFILSALEDNKRIDGRLLNERRELTIDFGREDGLVILLNIHF